MATSSMHKPGWRSRRRSRLSLVERAVPRLGRPIEDGAKTARVDEIRTASGKKPPTTSKATTTPALQESVGLARAEHQPPKNREGDAFETAPQTPAAAPESVSEYVSGQIGDDDQASPAREDAEIAEVEVEDVAATPSCSPEKPAPATVGFETPSPPADVAPSIQTRSEAETKETDGERGSEILGQAGSATAAGLVANIRTDEVDVTQSDEQELSTSPKLELDWNRLIDSGFTDPRDRGRPLSKNMDEVIRALIRQALSDQSSWRDRVILVTSPYERAGKTTAAINFAFGVTTVASHHAVLVDVDTTGPGAVDRLGGGDLTGITKALADESIELGDVVIKTDLERLTLVASGVGDDDTLDRFASRRMLQILRHLTENPDTILIIDAPPILLSQEAAVLSVIAGQVVLAVEAGRTTADDIEHALQRIGERHNVSLILNECSGVKDEEVPKIARRPRVVAAKQGPQSLKRRLPRAAAAASAFMLCLLVLPTVGQTGTSSAIFTEDTKIACLSTLPPERCPLDAEADLVPCHRMCR